MHECRKKNYCFNDLSYSCGKTGIPTFPEAGYSASTLHAKHTSSSRYGRCERSKQNPVLGNEIGFMQDGHCVPSLDE